MKEIILHTGFGGLGDNLMYTTLPELYSRDGYEVYIHKDSPRRNQEIYDLCWKRNPYIRGISDKSPNAGFSLTGNPYKALSTSFIGSVEKHHGFKEYHKYPKIYFDYRILEELEGKCIIDLTAITRQNDYPENIGQLILDEALKQYSENDILFLNFPHVQSKNLFNFSFKNLVINDIYEFCSVLGSCETYICLHSGGNMLATAIKQDQLFPNIVCFIPKGLHEMFVKNGNQSLFDNNIYITT